MSNFEYKVIPAPTNGKRGKGIKGADGRFANAFSETINELAHEGWEYMRAESLPSVERTGIMRKRQESFQNVLVFRRLSDAEPMIAKTDEAKETTFNPFKKFSTREEPVVVSAAAASLIEDKAEETATNTDDESVDITDDIDDFAESEMAKLQKKPSKPAD